MGDPKEIIWRSSYTRPLVLQIRFSNPWQVQIHLASSDGSWLAFDGKLNYTPCQSIQQTVQFYFFYIEAFRIPMYDVVQVTLLSVRWKSTITSNFEIFIHVVEPALIFTREFISLPLTHIRMPWSVRFLVYPTFNTLIHVEEICVDLLSTLQCRYQRMWRAYARTNLSISIAATESFASP